MYILHTYMDIYESMLIYVSLKVQHVTTTYLYAYTHVATLVVAVLFNYSYKKYKFYVYFTLTPFLLFASC